jgi:hypothetical protein
LKFQVEPLKRIDNAFKFVINIIKYTIIFGKNKTDLKAASQCNIANLNLINSSKYSYSYENSFN